MPEFKKHVDIIIPWLMFVAILVTALWTVIKNGTWWSEFVKDEYLPSNWLYYTLWAVFIVIYPIAYTVSLASVGTKGQRAFVHILYILMGVFIILWFIYLYKVRDTKKASIFLAVAGGVTLVSIIFMWYMTSTVAGILILFLLWLVLNWFLTSNAKERMFNNRIDDIKDRFKQFKDDIGTSME